jgi:hypothetical protein
VLLRGVVLQMMWLGSVAVSGSPGATKPASTSFQILNGLSTDPTDTSYTMDTRDDRIRRNSIGHWPHKPLFAIVIVGSTAAKVALTITVVVVVDVVVVVVVVVVVDSPRTPDQHRSRSVHLQAKLKPPTCIALQESSQPTTRAQSILLTC